MLMQIFFFGRHAATDMALGFVHVQDFSRLCGKCRVDLDNALCYILMYRALADSEFLCCLAHSGVVLDNIICDIYNPLLNIAFHKKSPAILIVTLYAGDSFICLSNFLSATRSLCGNMILI